MKGISGIIGGAIVILVLIVVVSLVLASLRYLYGVQQLEMRQAISEVSQPHIVQINATSVESSGELVVTYIIYPNGKVEKVGESVSGIRNFQSVLKDDPWAIIVFSNGQWVNVSDAQSYTGYNDFGVLGTGSYLVPYYPHPIDPSNISQLRDFLTGGVSYNTPLYFPVNVTETYNGSDEGIVTVNPSDPLVFGLGRILEVPVTSESGWFNFTITNIQSDQSIGFAIIVQNATGPLVVLYFKFSYWQVVTGWHKVSPGVWEGTISGWAYNFTYGIYQAWINPTDIPPGYTYSEWPYFMSQSISYEFSNGSTEGNWFLERLTGTSSLQLQYDPIIKVAMRFTPGKPAEMYLWIGNYNGSGISWYKVLLPSIEAPVGSEAGVGQVFIMNGVGLAPSGMYYTVYWPNVTHSSWPVNLYTEAPGNNGTYWPDNLPKSIYLEPLVPRPGSAIEVIPYMPYMYAGTVIVNVAYTI